MKMVGERVCLVSPRALESSGLSRLTRAACESAAAQIAKVTGVIMNILVLSLAISLASAEICIRLLGNYEESRTIRKKPSRFWRWNNRSREFEQLEALRLNNTALCSVDTVTDLSGKTLVVAADHMNPYIIIKQNNSGVTGFIGDAWTILEETLKFKTIYRRAGPFTSRTLMNGQTHALLAATAIYSYTSGYYTYSTTITTNSYALFVQSEGTKVSTWWYARIFSRGLWLMGCVFVAILTVAVTLVYYVKRHVCSDYVESDELSSLSFNLLCVLGGISGQGFPKLPRSCSLRVLVLSQLLMGMLLSCGFSSTLTSYLANRGTSVPLSSLEDVLQKKTHSLCLRNDSSAYIHFTVNRSPESEIKDEWKDLINKGCPDMRDTSTLSSTLCKPGRAYLEAPDVFLPIYRQVRDECRIVKTYNEYWSLRLAFLHARSSQYKDVIDHYLMRLASSGILHYLERKWITSEEDDSSYEWNAFQPVEYAHIHIGVCGLAIMSMVSLIICLLENIWSRVGCEFRTIKRKTKLSRISPIAGISKLRCSRSRRDVLNRAAIIGIRESGCVSDFRLRRGCRR